jgi:hypothetical protein
MSEAKKTVYYQFDRIQDLPIYVRFEDQNLETVLQDLLKEVGFAKIDEEDFKSHKLTANKTRVLNVVEASVRVTKQIGSFVETDTYGAESFTPLGDYDVYRYKGMAMMVTGDNNYQWHLGLVNIAHEKSYEIYKQVFNRYLAFTLASYGVVGFWGVPVDEGFVVMNSQMSNGEAVYIDWKNQKILTQDGAKSLNPFTQVLRLDSTLKGRSIEMRQEELLSFLSTHTTYMSYTGLHHKLKEQLIIMASEIHGVVYPLENFQHRSTQTI